MARFQSLAKWLVGGLIIPSALVYIGDYVSLQYRIPGNREQFATVEIDPYLAIPQKGGRTEFVVSDPINETCVNSLFPHFDDSPCWYVRQHRKKRIQM